MFMHVCITYMIMQAVLGMLSDNPELSGFGIPSTSVSVPDLTGVGAVQHAPDAVDFSDISDDEPPAIVHAASTLGSPHVSKAGSTPPGCASGQCCGHKCGGNHRRTTGNLLNVHGCNSHVTWMVGHMLAM
jgi:hypothetical protein